MCAVCDVTVSSHVHVSKPTFLRSLLTIICMLFYDTHSLYFMCHCTEYKLSALQVRISEESKLNATTQQLIIAKISGCALKHGSKTHSSLRQNYLQLKNKAALMSHRIRAVEHRKCAAGLAGAHPVMQERSAPSLISHCRLRQLFRIK